jgi:hypothetical protein
MELATPELIASLLGSEIKPRKPTARHEARNQILQVRPPKRRRCQCGGCANCIENARWERIFTEKFSDPDYYKPKLVSFGSSLQWLP